MTREVPRNIWSVKRAKEIARKVLDDGYDPLLACRDVADLRSSLPGVSDETMDTFVGVASEVDGLPIGPERKYWAAEALRSHDSKIADNRAAVRSVVETAFREMLEVPLYEIGDYVRVKDSAAVEFRPGEFGPAINIFPKARECLAGDYFERFPDGVVYPIELEGGDAVDVHENDLEFVR